jgi:hypothetical protein
LGCYRELVSNDLRLSSPLSDVVTLLFYAGFLLRLTVIPPWWKWYSYM